MSTIVSVGRVLFSKYTPLTTIWASFKGPILPKVIYVMNRYFTEAALLYTAYVFTGSRGPTANKVSACCATVFWLITMSATLFAGILQFLIMLRAYRLWDHKQTMRRVLLAVFVACMTGSLVLSVKMVLTLLETQVPEVPKTGPFLMGILLLFNLFVISASFYNALEEPRRRESEVFYSLRRDGVKVYFVSVLPSPSDVILWVLLLITSLFAKMLVYFPILILSWSVAANLTSRMHLRIESLRLSNNAHPTMMYATPED
ncbi:hypothetical protein EDD85DRAFT_815389 [Armillaria nabsnona]|nr:hypothetical protein EDD85DRAFT_815389 [Armillaria nabsnona]